METYTAKNYQITFDDTEKSLVIYKLNDENETTSYNRKKRGYAKAKAQIISAIKAGDLSTFEQWTRVFQEIFKLDMRTYCGLD